MESIPDGMYFVGISVIVKMNQKRKQLNISSLTTAVSIDQVGKPPDISKSDGVAETGQNEFDLRWPISSLIFIALDTFTFGDFKNWTSGNWHDDHDNDGDDEDEVKNGNKYTGWEQIYTEYTAKVE